MITIERTVTIHRPVEEVFAYLSEVEHGPQYVSGQRQARKTSAGAMGVGATFATTSSFLRRTGTNRVTEYEPHSRLAWTATSGAASTTSWSLEPSGESTRVRFTVAAHVPGLLRLAESLIAERTSARVDHDLGALKELLAVTRTTTGMGKAW